MAERANQALVEIAKSMLLHAGMLLKFWAEVVANAADIRYLFLSPRDRTKTSYEIVGRKIPLVSLLRIFVSIMWAHIPTEKRPKLDLKSEEGVLIPRFENGMCKVWLKKCRKAIVTKHVKISEGRFPVKGWYNDLSSEIGDASGQTQIYSDDVTSNSDQDIVKCTTKSTTNQLVDLFTPGNEDGTTSTVKTKPYISITGNILKTLTHVLAVPSTYQDDDSNSCDMETIFCSPGKHGGHENKGMTEPNKDSTVRRSNRRRNATELYSPRSHRFSA